MDQQLIISVSPHVSSDVKVKTAMRDVVLSLLPASIASVIIFGLNALLLILITTGACLLTEYLIRKHLLKRDFTLRDWSAAVTGILLALTLPPATPWWIAVLGAVMAIAIAKEIQGGLGHNIFNPALIGRAFIHMSWGALLVAWLVPMWWTNTSFMDFASTSIVENKLQVSSIRTGKLDDVIGATPLAIIKPSLKTEGEKPAYMDMFLGTTTGSLGETSALALLLGGLYLLWRKHIDWRIPGSFIGTVALLTLLLGQDPVYHVLGGGLLLGALFMATDWVTSPVTQPGKLVFGVGCGILTVVIRMWGGYPEGVYFSILFMNALAPLIDKFLVPKPFGAVTS